MLLWIYVIVYGVSQLVSPSVHPLHLCRVLLLQFLALGYSCLSSALILEQSFSYSPLPVFAISFNSSAFESSSSSYNYESSHEEYVFAELSPTMTTLNVFIAICKLLALVCRYCPPLLQSYVFSLFKFRKSSIF